MSRSWIGKAHIIGASLTATYVHPDQFRDDGSFPSTTTTTQRQHQNNLQHQQGPMLTPAASDEHLRAAPLSTTTTPTTTKSTHDNDWVVVTNGTPASCAQLGIYELFRDRGEIDLVVSGPNHGRNASTIFNLSSGTVGGALEAATCAKRGIALSFGSKDEQPKEVIRAAAKLSARLIEYLYRNWDGKVELYNVNVPMRADVETRPVRYTTALPIVWTKGSLYAESTSKTKTKSNGSAVSHETTEKSLSSPRERHFQWSAELSDIKQSLREGPEGTDARTVLDGFTRYFFPLFLYSNYIF
jgi:5'/3'-nucleotidase SurE